MAKPGERVAIFMSALTIGSRERLMLELAASLAQMGRQVDILLAGANTHWHEAIPDKVVLYDLLPWSESVPVLRSVNIAKLVFSWRRLVRYLRSEQPGVLLSVSIPPNLVAAFAHKRARSAARLLMRQSNVVRIAKDPQYGGIRRRLRDPLISRMYRQADGFIAVSDGVADNLRLLMPALKPDAVRVIYNRVIPADYHLQMNAPVHHPWLQRADYKIVVAVGRLVKKKDYPTLLAAFKSLLERVDARLIVLGEGPERARLEALLRQLDIVDKVDLHGFDPNPAGYLARADLYVLSSISEGMPSALVEALACGCNVVSTDCPAGPAEILDYGQFGLLVPVGNVAALARAMQERLTNPLKTETLVGRADCFAASDGVVEYADAIDQLGVA